MVVGRTALGNVTTKPLPVLDNIKTFRDDNTKEATIVWEPNPDSLQDVYKITYYELEAIKGEFGDSSSVYTDDTSFSLTNLQPGRNYSISISAVSHGIESVQRSIFQATSKLSKLIRNSLFLNLRSFKLLLENG